MAQLGFEPRSGFLLFPVLAYVQHTRGGQGIYGRKRRFVGAAEICWGALEPVAGTDHTHWTDVARKRTLWFGGAPSVSKVSSVSPSTGLAG